MKELMKTRNITVAVIIVLLILAFGFMSYNRPQYSFTMSSEEMLTQLDEVKSIGLKEARNMVKSRDENTVFVDIRKSYDYEVKSIPDAINIPVAHLLDDENFALLEEMKENGKMVVLFGNSETQSKLPFMLLYELGLDNVRFLCGGLDDFFNEKLQLYHRGTDI
jgi:rhodanese-related sulfurtransferase